MATGYDNSITILRKNKDANVEQGVTLKSIDVKLDSQSTSSDQLDQTDNLILSVKLQEEQLAVSIEILEQIKALRGGEFNIT